MTNPLLSKTELQINQRVKIYRNLRKRLFSVLDKKSRRLIAYMDTLVLTNVEFKVSKAGQDRVRREKLKNVHAYVIGDYIGNDIKSIAGYKPVYYNPYITDTFVTMEDNIPIFKARKCYFSDGICYVEE
ncbi:hypothetical protein ABE288_09525 [Bacillus salipaludis]|uniref:hypothetical protein n=1 Tax=Bacillus salipaludis TaxID=2547811 RepID=UPI003D197B12